MIGAVGQAGQAQEMRGPGKKDMAVGQQAKAIVAVAREAGLDLPRGAQGVAASAIARGIDAESLLMARFGGTEGSTDVAPVEEAEGIEGIDLAPGEETGSEEDVAEVVTDEGEESVAEIAADGGEARVGISEKMELIVSEVPEVALLFGDDAEETAI